MRSLWNALLFLLLIYVLFSILLTDCVWNSCNILVLRVEMNPFDECSLGFQALFRIQSLTFWHCSTGLLNISDLYLSKIKNFGVHNASRMLLLEFLEYRRPPRLEGLQGLQTFAIIYSRMFLKQALMYPLKLIYSKSS